MVDFFKTYQLNIMLGLTSICLIIALFVSITKTLSKQRKRALIMMELCAAVWLEADRIAYMFHGVTGETGYYAVRISNFFVFLMTIGVLYAVNKYLIDLVVTEGNLTSKPLMLRVSDMLALIAGVLVVVSQFTGLYYTFNENNEYSRSDYYLISYIFPYLILIIQFASIIVYRKMIKGVVGLSVVMFEVVSIVASFIQIFVYGISLTDMSVVVMVIGLYIFAIIDMNERVERANKMEIAMLKGEQESMQRLFDQTATVLAAAIEEKNIYSRGHSLRVAGYSKEIARLSGKDENECTEIYYSALLHDVGKIGISDDAVSMDNVRSEEENESYKDHSVIGGKILSAIREFPYLGDAARYHHERYDGKGYPEGLRGEDIPDYARIVAVADDYDKMTSGNGYRDALPQRTVREEFIKGAGTVYDPEYARIMVDMIDGDVHYLMKAKKQETDIDELNNLTKVTEMHFGEYRERISDGIKFGSGIIRIHLDCLSYEGYDDKISIPTIILFYSFDGCVHKDDSSIRILNYTEYGEIWLDGHTISTAARNIKVNKITREDASGMGQQNNTTDTQKHAVKSNSYDIEAVMYKDHAKIRIIDSGQITDVTVAFPDSYTHTYLAFTGEHCHIMNVKIEDTGEQIDENYIPRIAEEISYINRREGDIPNVQIDGKRSSMTEGLPVTDGLQLIFHTMSLPSASLVWNCAYIIIYSSDNGKVDGDNYRELACIRLDGEDSTQGREAVNELIVRKEDSFAGWNAWKEYNKKGFECEVSFRRKKRKIIMTTENAGIYIKNVTTVTDGTRNIYVALTGDQCALTDIRFNS